MRMWVGVRVWERETIWLRNQYFSVADNAPLSLFNLSRLKTLSSSSYLCTNHFVCQFRSPQCKRASFWTKRNFAFARLLSVLPHRFPTRSLELYRAQGRLALRTTIAVETSDPFCRIKPCVIDCASSLFSWCEHEPIETVLFCLRLCRYTLQQRWHIFLAPR